MTLNKETRAKTQNLQQDQVRHNFSKHAAEYERYAQVQKTVAENLVACLPTICDQDRVLEIGCGTGVLSRKLLRKHPRMNLILSDIAHGMSRKVAVDYPHLPVVDADAACLPFADASFDLICSSSVYQWVDNLPRAFAELHRVLRPGGRIILALFGEQTLFELRQSHAAALENRQSHSQDFPDLDQLQAVTRPLLSVETLHSALEVEWHDTVPALLRSLKAIGAQNASRQRPRGLGSRRTMQRMCDSYRQVYAQKGKIPATYEVITLVASKL